MTKIYKKIPHHYIDGIAIYEDLNDPYIVNYEHIANDHLAEMARSSQNPFMTSSQISESLADTREVIIKHARPGARILDAGVGLGGLLESLENYEKYGVDVALPYLKVAKSSGINVALANLENLPYDDRVFDCVITCDVLEHVFRLDKVLSELLRVLAPKGLLVIRVPNDECLDGYLTNIQPYEHSHVRGFNLVSIRLLLEKCFNLQYIDHCYTAKFFGISSQLKFPMPSKNDGLLAELSNLLRENPFLMEDSHLHTIFQLSKLSIEDMVDSVLGLRATLPNIYDRLAPCLIKPAEVIVVFKKKEELC